MLYATHAIQIPFPFFPVMLTCLLNMLPTFKTAGWIKKTNSQIIEMLALTNTINPIDFYSTLHTTLIPKAPRHGTR